MNPKKKSRTPDGQLSSLAARFRYARKLKGLTQREVANMSGVDQQVVSQVETGEIKRPKEIQALAQAVGQSPGWLQFGIERLDNLDVEAVDVALAWQILPEPLKEALKTAILEAAKTKPKKSRPK